MSAAAKEKNEFPEKWERVLLEEISSDISYGYTASSTEEPVGPKMLRITDIQNNAVNWNAVPYCKIDEDQVDKYLLAPNDIVFARTGATVGKSFLIPSNVSNSIYASYLIRVRLAEGIDPKYISYFFHSGDYWLQIRENQAGIGQPNVNGSKLKKLEIPLAPPEQQKRIVAKIEEIFSHIDAGIKALKKAKQLLKQYRQSVLKAAVTGELTKEWREARNKGDAQGSANVAGGRTPGATKLEPASQLLERILKERREKWEEQQLEQFKAKGKMSKDDKWKGKYKEPVQIENGTGLVELPQGWEWICLDSLIIDGPQNGLYLPKTKYGSGVPIIRIDDFQDGYVRPYEELQKVEASESEKKIYGIHAGNLVINRVNSPTHLGKCMIVQDGYEPCLFESNMMKVDVSTHIEVGYIDYYIQSKFGRTKLIKNAKWAVNQASINQQDVKNTEITLPQIEEQHVIVRLVEEKLESLNRLMSEIEVQLIKAEKNKQSILASCFSGLL